jgi:hypothetical protein
MALPPRLRIVVFPDTPKSWTARSLEHDLAAAGRTAEAAIDTLVKIAQAHIMFDSRHGHEPLSAFQAAPQLYWNAFARSASKPIEMTRTERGTVLQYFVSMVPQNPALSKPRRPLRIA